MERVTVKQAAQELNMNVECLRWMMANDRLPIGVVNKRQNRSTFYIYREWLDAFKKGER